MTSRRVTENGVLCGPWDNSQGEGSPWWGWIGDEETLPLLNQAESDGETADLERVIAGLWNITSVNPLEENLWSPLREPLLEQETFPSEPVNVEVSNAEVPLVELTRLKFIGLVIY